jgi:hypothetical protein
MSFQGGGAFQVVAFQVTGIIGVVSEWLQKARRRRMR